PADELAKTQLLLTRAMPQDFESDAQVAGAFAALVTDGRPLDWYQSYAAGLRAVTADDARAAADAAWKDLSIVIVGDWAKVGKDLATLGLPIVRYDTAGKKLP